MAGIDLQSFAVEVSQNADDADVGRRAFHLRNIISQFQDSFTVLEKVIYCYLLLWYLSF